MKVKSEFFKHVDGKRYFHFWFVPSVEIDSEYFNNQKYGDYKWTHIVFSWLVWSFDIEFIRGR